MSGEQRNSTKTKQTWRLLRIIGGFALLGLGIVGLFLPILQGIAFIIAGLLLLAREYHWARNLLNWVRRKRGGPQKHPARTED
jgi:uncharacterized membrane protein YbaN (DUF454 family)